MQYISKRLTHNGRIWNTTYENKKGNMACERIYKHGEYGMGKVATLEPFSLSRFEDFESFGETRFIIGLKWVKEKKE